MNETQTTTWARYRHRQNQNIEFDVEVSDGEPVTLQEPISGEFCFRFRTIRNHGHHEEIHTPAFTYMPTSEFHVLYERVT